MNSSPTAPATRARTPWLLAFLFLALAAGVWLLLRAGIERDSAVVATAVAPGQSSEAESRGLLDAQALEAQRYGGEQAQLALPGGIPIPAGVRLRGDGQLEGRVLSREDGQGVPGARVDLLALPPAATNLFGRVLRLAKLSPGFESRVLPIATTGTDTSGRFAFEGVRAGEYFLEARAARHVPDQPRQARVAPSGAGGPLDVWVRAGGRVLGQVLRPDGAPAPRATVAIFQGPGALITAAKSGDLRYLETQCDASGRFVLCGVAPGTGYDLAASGDGLCVSHLTELEVRAGEDEEVVLRARAGCSVAGRVLSAGLDEQESRPLAGAHVGAVPRGLRDLHFAEEILLASHCITDDDGRYLMKYVPPGEFDVCAIAPRHVAGKGGQLRAAEGLRVEAEPIVLHHGPMVKGRVIDPGGAPLPGVTVRWDLVDWDSLQFDLTLAPLLSQAVQGFDFPRTDEEGRFEAGALADDPPHRLDFYKPGFAEVHHRWDPDKESGELEIVMGRGGSVEGVVIDADKAEPVTSFSISGSDRIDQEGGAPGAINPFSGAQLVEDPSGRFRVPALQAGKRALTFVAPGYQSTTVEDLEIKEGEVLRGLIVELAQGGTISGKVVDAKGEPVAGAQVFAIEEGKRGDRPRRGRGGPFAQLGESASEDMPRGALGFAAGIGLTGGDAEISAADGAYALKGLQDGAYGVSAAHRDYALGSSQTVQLGKAGKVEGVQVVMSVGGGLFGTVTDRFERPVPGAIVVVVNPAGMVNSAGKSGSREGGDIYQASCDDQGGYRISHMQGGGYFVALVRGDQALNPMSFLGTLQFDLVTVPGDDMLRYDVVDRSSSACRVWGQVLAAGRPAGAGGIFAMSFEGDNALGLDVKIAQVRPDGSYEFPGLAPGSYRFTYEGQGPEVRLQIEVPDLPEYHLDLVLPEGGISGRVLAAGSSTPVRRAEVVLRSKESRKPQGLLGEMFAREARDARAFTEEDGSFRLSRLAAGEYMLEVRGPRWGADQGKYAPLAPRPISVEEGRVETGLEIELRVSLRIAGLVSDGEGRPVSGARVVALYAGKDALAPERASADKQGRFELRALAEGCYDLHVSADGFAELRVEDVEARTGTEALQFLLERGVSARVRVTDAQGQPVAGAVGRLVPAKGRDAGLAADPNRSIAGWLKGQGMSGLDGWVDLGRHMPGEYHLEVTRGAQQASRRDVVLEEGRSSELEVSLP